MSRKDEEYLFDCIEGVIEEVHQNNLMLRDIVKVLNWYLANHQKENEEDFSRNVLANLISTQLEIGRKGWGNNKGR